jgi:hypothetical protein
LRQQEILKNAQLNYDHEEGSQDLI